MLFKFTAFALVLSFTCTSVLSACERDRNVKIKDPMYLNYGDGFFYIHGLTNGESVVMYKHPDDVRIFGQYTFKDERCIYETVYYFVERGQFEFTNPYISDEANFNITNKISFVKNGAGYEIEYNLSPRGVGIFHNLGQQAEISILPNLTIKKTPALRVRQLNTKFDNIGKQNLKVSYLKNGQSYIQFITKRQPFSSIEGQYTLRTSDRKYHTITYEIPIDEFDYNGVVVREYEMSTQENFYKTGTLRLLINGEFMDVKYFIDKRGFHVGDLIKQGPPTQAPALPNTPVVQALQTFPQTKAPQTAATPAIDTNEISITSNAPSRPTQTSQPTRNNRLVRNQRRLNRQSAVNSQPPRLNPTFSRPDLLTGNRSVQPGK